ncbi:MAG: hypothetical protein DIU79_06275 [Actinobacteria bacterium]|nr:MAG: hypothetical protein DIU79_06275 [Actinomycetota bacterium]
MRLTVGPLPAAVYWRRRAIVLGALLLFVAIIVYACSGRGDSGERTNASASSTPTPDGVSPSVLAPETSAPPSEEESESDDTEDVASGGAQAPAPVGVVDREVCTDDEIAVTPVASNPSPRVGMTIELRIRIKNISNRTCKRDVGADYQELYIKQGARLVWSSDTCGTARGSKVDPFPPYHEQEFRVSWNGRESSSCANGEAAGPFLQPGEYQLFGRLDSKVSDPVKLVVMP